MITSLAVLAGLVVLYTLVAKRLDRLSITMPIVFILLGAAAGPQGLGLLDFPISTKGVEAFVELTLALLIFADASSLDFHQVRRAWQLPGRLLVVGFPLIVVLGALAAYLFFPEGKIGFALLVGAVLAPSDASLGLPMFNNPKVPVFIRQALNVESGLNDGLAAPLVSLFLALNLEEQGLGGNWLIEAALEIGIGALLGIAAGLVGGWLFNLSENRGGLSRTGRLIGNIGLALFVYYGARTAGGNGFVAAFIGGLMFAYITGGKLHDATEYTEITGTTLSVFVWTAVGASLLIQLFAEFDFRVVLYALLSLTIVRMIPVALAMIGTRLRKDTILMMGWFGPRGLASIVFMLLAHEQAQQAGVPPDSLVNIVGWTVLLSVFLHGLSAVPLANWYERRLASVSPEALEFEELPELQSLRRRPVM